MNSQPKQCPICKRIFHTKRVLEMHISNHVSDFLDSFKTYKCHICDEAFVNSTLKESHFQRLHVEQIQCDHCKKTFSNKLSLKKHILEDHKCESCNDLVKNKNLHICKIFLKFFHSSHGRESRHLPFFIRESFANQNKYMSPVIDALPSRKLNYVLINDILNSAKQNSHKKQLNFFCIGDNNLRWNKDTLDTFMTKLKYLVKELSKVPNCHLVLASILPQPVSDVKSKSVFRSANSAMKDLCQQYQNISFMDVTKSFVIDNIIDETLFEKDGVHMKPKGAKKYANCIKRHAMWLPL